MTARTAALVVMLSLAAPPLVGILCGVWCDSGHEHHAAAGADGHAAPGGHAHHGAAGPAGPALIGEHVCDHGLGVVDVYGPSSGARTPLPAVVTTDAAVPVPPEAVLVTRPWSPPLERVLGPPARSPVLRI